VPKSIAVREEVPLAQIVHGKQVASDAPFRAVSTAIVPMFAGAVRHAAIVAAAGGAAAEIGNIVVGRFTHALDLVPSSAGCRR